MHPTLPPLQISLQGIADLANVRRPAVSMWRSRMPAGSPAPFPAPVSARSGNDIFDAQEVAAWLVDTGHGNNPHAVDDAAAYALLPGFVPEGPSGFARLTAMITLYAGHGGPIGGMDVQALRLRADNADPTDTFLLREIGAIDEDGDLVDFAQFIDVLVDSAYSPQAAFEIVMRSRLRATQRDRARTALSEDALDLVSATALELSTSTSEDPDDHPADGARFGLPESLVLVDPTGASGDLVMATLSRAGEGTDLSIVTADAGLDAARLLRRRLAAHRVLHEGLAVYGEGEFALDSAADRIVHVAQYPSSADPTASAEQVLAAIENIVLQMDDRQCGVVIAPASILSDGGLDPRAAELRSSLLRSGRVRAIVRLQPGLLLSSPRVSLALWVLGPAHSGVSLAERWTMVADLSAEPLTETTQRELVGDLAAAMGGRSSLRAHSFRFARLVLTRALLTRSGSLVEKRSVLQHTPAPVTESSDARSRESAALVLRAEQLIDSLGASTEHPKLLIEASADGVSLPPTSLGALAAAGHLRYRAGARIDAGIVADGMTSGHFTVIGVAELLGESEVGSRGVDRLQFSAQFPNVRLSLAGDVVFCTSPGVRAMVDLEGSSVIEYPARILRINSADPAGLVPAVLAADICAVAERTPAPPISLLRDWRRWTARRLPRDTQPGVRSVLSNLDELHELALARLAQLDELRSLVIHGSTSGRLAVTALPTTSDSNRLTKGNL